MVMVLCVMAVFLALSATILLAGSVTLTTARNNVLSERSKIQAVSLSELLMKDMQRDLTDAESYLPQYVREQILGGWIAYEEDADNREEAVKSFLVDADEGTGERTDQMRIEMYWMGDGVPDEEDKDVSGNVETQNIHLYINVISVLNGRQFHVQRELYVTGIVENPDADTNTDYPCIWKWNVIGRSNEK